MRFRAVVLLFAAGGCNACSSPSAPQDAGPDATVDGPAGDVAADSLSCTPPLRPSYVPAGWVTYEDYAPCAGLYIPTDALQLPPPITWQDCESAAGVGGCRRIAIDWGPQPSALQGSTNDAALLGNGHVVVITNRAYAAANGQVDHAIAVVADADGPVYNAILATTPNRFAPYVYIPPEFSPPRWVLQVLENNTFNGGGFIAGTLGELRPQAHGRINGGAPSYAVGDLGILQIGPGVQIHDYDSGAPLYTIQGSLPMSFEWMFRSSVFWQGNSGRVNDVGRWDPDAGAVDFINYGFDPDHAAGALGTDGTDMVWAEGHGSASDAGFWTTADFWTSPYVTDRSQLQPRRLRSAPQEVIGSSRIAVGCGYAAAYGTAGAWIVRIADGWGWFLSNTSGWHWQAALAVSCTEAFFQVAISGPILTMARVAFAQLGPGLAPD